MRMRTFEAKKLALELKVLRSQTRCEIYLGKNKVIFLTLSEALRQGDNYLEPAVNIIYIFQYVPKVLFNKRFWFKS